MPQPARGARHARRRRARCAARTTTAGASRCAQLCCSRCGAPGRRAGRARRRRAAGHRVDRIQLLEARRQHMQLVRFSAAARPARRSDMSRRWRRIHDLSRATPTIASFVDGVSRTAGRRHRSIMRGAAVARGCADVVLRPPIDAASTLYLVGANYRKHAERGRPRRAGDPGDLHASRRPRWSGRGKPIALPPISTQMDYEGELAVVIGRARHPRVRRAMRRACVAGYTIVNDVTARDLQWVELGKHRIVDWFSRRSALDESTPVGPWIVPATSAAMDPHTLQPHHAPQRRAHAGQRHVADGVLGVGPDRVSRAPA